MIGQYLNKYYAWLDDAIKSSDSFISDDIDWFIRDLSKKAWLLSGISILTLTKRALKDKGLAFPVSIVFSLKTTIKQGNVPCFLTNQLFNNVSTPPTIYIFKSQKKEEVIKEEKAFLSRLVKIDSMSIGLPIKCDSFYCEKKYSYPKESYYDRYLMFLL